MKAILSVTALLSICTSASAGTLHEGYWPTLRHSNFELTATINGEDSGAWMRFANGSHLRHTVDRDDMRTLAFTRDGSLWQGAEIEFIDGHEYRVRAAFIGEHLVTEVQLDGAMQRTEIPLPTVWDEPITHGELERVAPNEWILRDVGGPWHNLEGAVIYDTMLGGDHWQLTMDRFGYVTKDVALIPEPATWLLACLAGLSLACHRLWRPAGVRRAVAA